MTYPRFSINPTELLGAIHKATNHLDAALLETAVIEMHPWTWAEIATMIEASQVVTSKPGQYAIFGYEVRLSEDVPVTRARLVVEIDTPLRMGHA